MEITNNRKEPYKYSRTLGSTMLSNPLHSKIKLINEKFHVYKVGDSYDNIIWNTFKFAEADLLNRTTPDLVDDCPTGTAVFQRTAIFLPNIGKVNLYIFIDPERNEHEAYNCSLYEEEESEGINYHITSNETGESIKEASVVLILPPDYQTLLSRDDIIGIIRHELLHLLHKTNNQKMADAVGWAYMLASAISQAENLKGAIPDHITLKAVADNPEFTEIDIKVAIISAVYHLDNNEMEAWLQSFYSHCKASKRNGIDGFKDIPDYVVYNSLKKCLIKYRRPIMALMFTNPDETIPHINRYLEHNHYEDLNEAFEDWLKKLDNQLKKLNRIGYECGLNP